MDVTKRPLKFLIIPFLVWAYANAAKQTTPDVVNLDSGFSLYQDTVFVDIKGNMRYALKYHDKYYVIFQQSILKYGGYEKRWLYIFSNGKIEKVVDCPEKMNAKYLDFYVKNDSIICKQYMDKRHYYFDTQNFIWKEIDNTDDLIFEDENFYVFSLDFGEWGGNTWFKDKKTGVEYEIAATTPLVNRIDSTYYLTNSFQILKTENPLILNQCDARFTYQNIRKDANFDFWYNNPREPSGFNVVYKDKTYNYFDLSYKPHIVSSFVWQNELLHVYETDTATYISTIENNSIQTIKKIGEKLRFFNWAHSYRCKNLNGNNELLKFRTKDGQLFGLMKIIDNKVFVHYFSNKAELKPKTYNMEKTGNIFINRLNYILSDLGNLQLKDVDLAENDWGSFFNTPNNALGEWKAYLIQEDSLISNSIMYHATKTNDLVRFVQFEWAAIFIMTPNWGKLVKEAFEAKLHFLEKCITQKAGNPIQNEEDKYSIKKVWQTSNGLKIELRNSKSSNNITLNIKKN